MIQTIKIYSFPQSQQIRKRYHKTLGTNVYYTSPQTFMITFSFLIIAHCPRSLYDFTYICSKSSLTQLGNYKKFNVNGKKLDGKQCLPILRKKNLQKKPKCKNEIVKVRWNCIKLINNFPPFQDYL